jgi:hypothetical protein
MRNRPLLHGKDMVPTYKPSLRLGGTALFDIVERFLTADANAWAIALCSDLGGCPAVAAAGHGLHRSFLTRAGRQCCWGFPRRSAGGLKRGRWPGLGPEAVVPLDMGFIARFDGPAGRATAIGVHHVRPHGGPLLASGLPPCLRVADGRKRTPAGHGLHRSLCGPIGRRMRGRDRRATGWSPLHRPVPPVILGFANRKDDSVRVPARQVCHQAHAKRRAGRRPDNSDGHSCHQPHAKRSGQPG